MSKHTPGPWHVGFSDGSGSFDEVTCAKPGAYITTGDGDDISVVVRGGNPEGDLPYGVLTPEDAQLIAAAPDLLAIAVKAESLISGDLVGAEWKRACADFVKEARTAIAKAEGA